MLRSAAFIGFCLVAGQARAQQPIPQTGIGASTCLFADRAFSSGAYLCVSKSIAVTCSDGRWSPQRAQPCDHDLDPFKPSYGR